MDETEENTKLKLVVAPENSCLTKVFIQGDDMIFPEEITRRPETTTPPLKNYVRKYLEMCRNKKYFSFKVITNELRKPQLSLLITSETINKPKIKQYKESSYSSDDWLFYGQMRFPKSALAPKIKSSNSGDSVKDVERLILKKLNELKRYDISVVLHSCYKVLPVDLIPLDYVLSKDSHQFGLYGEGHFLPINLFDDNISETRTPNEWLDSAVVNGVKYCVPAKAFIPCVKDVSTLDRTIIPHNWEDVGVFEYEPKSEMFHVMPANLDRGPFRVTRLLICFKGESTLNAAKRIANAVNLRNYAENSIRYNTLIDFIPKDPCPSYDLDSMFNLLNKITRNGQLRVFDKPLRYLVTFYKKVLTNLYIQDIVKKDPETFKYIYVPIKTVWVPPESEKPTGITDLAKRQDYLKRHWIYSYPEVWQIIMTVTSECTKALEYNIFATEQCSFVPLEEFLRLQEHCQTTFMMYMLGEWKNVIVNKLHEVLGNFGRGHYNLNQSDWTCYRNSKVPRILGLIRFIMERTLNVNLRRNLTNYVAMFEASCESTFLLNKYFKWGENIIQSPFVPLIKPIFSVELFLSETGAYYSTPVEQFEVAILSKLDKAIRDTHTIERLGRTVNEHLRYSKEIVYFTSIGFQEFAATDAFERIQRAIRCAIIPLLAYANEYDRFLPLFNLVVDEYIEKYGEENHPPYEVREEIEFHLRAKEKLKSSIPESIVIGPFSIKTSNIKNILIKKREELVTKQLRNYSLRMMDKMYAATHEYMSIFRKLSDRPNSVEHIIEIKEWMETIPITVKGQQEVIKKILQDYELLDLYWWPLEDEEFETKWAAITWPHKISNKVVEVTKTLSEEWAMFQKLHVDNEMTIQDKIETISGNITQLSIQDNIARVHEIAVDVRKTWKMIREAIDFGHVLNQRQKVFGLPITPYDDVQRLMKDFEPYKNLWGTASDWLKLSEILLDNPLVNIEDDNLDFEISEYHKTMTKCTRIFTDFPACMKIAQDIKGQIEEFRPFIPVLHALKNAGMRKRHWDEFSEASGLKIQMTPILSLSKCISMGIMENADDLVRISDMAGKEYTIEQALDRMENEWKNANMSVSPFKQTGTYIMRVTDEQMQLLDDQIAATQQLSFSPFKGPFEERIGDWETKLRLAQAVIEEWVECQRQWMYLESIFASEDISSQLPFESKKFSVVSRSWERIMRAAFENNVIMSICPSKRLLEQLKTNNYALEVVQKGLAEYLEMKRLAFPRFFFLSDDELLEILAQARNPLAVQPHMRKCFENIKKLTFLDDLRITQMHSAEGECVDMIPEMYPTGTVESWLLRVEENMANTLKVKIYDSMQTIEETPRGKWVLEWPGQIVIAGCQAYWTAHVEDAINKKHIEGYYEVMLEHLDTLRNLVRGPLKRVERQVLSALIVIEVHARDVTYNLMDLNISNVNEFDWISQLRYYLVDIDLKIRAVNAEFQYAYEYLGNSGRLVITPLTDRCYLTLTGALHLKFGGAPAGPAGTGKTETTKDLAKAFAIQCVVFNCSDQLDFMAMGKFFKGLASSGAWACFDEFNRIDIEVLSVIAQQIMTIQKAQITRAERFMFEGTDLKLKPSCAVFITMNPGYAGRTELPDNLKALFRPVAMMVPDYTLIAEISLFSFGFSNAKSLAGKITSTFKLSSEQLSSQDHYDFGMRAVKTVITVAGNLKREHPTMDESQIIWRSLKDVNVPKFLVNDLKLFNGIVSDLFPRLVEEPIDYGKLELAIRQTLLEYGLEDVDDYVKKVIQLYETTVVRHGLMLVGPTGSGKTKCYEVLKDAMTSLTGQPSPSGYPFTRVWTYVLNPKSITMGQLYGEFDLMSHEWTDGILPSMVRVGANSTDSDKRWYVFDGPVDAVWIENMNTVLDDNKKLCLTSGEIIKLSEHMTLMFEVADLAVASPATVSRCGMVYLEPSVLGLQPYVNCWIKRLPELARHLSNPLRELLNTYLLPGVEFLRGSLRELVTSIDSSIVLSFFRLMDCFMHPLTCPGGKPPPSKAAQTLLPSLIVPWTVFSLVWSVGGTSDSASREKFTNWLDKTMRESNHEPLFPDGNGYDYRLFDGGFTTATDEGDLHPPAWINWMHNVEAFNITIDTKYSDIEIPTIDNVRSADVIGTLLNFNANVLCIGPTGTGKTLTVLSKLNKNMPKKFICDFINFSARTSSNQTQDLIESKLEKRRRGVLGPPLLKQMVIFIDDFNMPALETYGAQPPIELIRQWMDFGGWYNRRNVGEFRKLIDVSFIAAMGPPGGGRNPVTARLLRHFHYISFNELNKSSQETIFRNIIQFWLELTPSVSAYTELLLGATLNVYSTIVQELLPTPAKTHYTFNLRDLSKVFQGIYMASPDNMLEVEDLIKLWIHENCRVFQDRLVNDEDRTWFDQLLDQQLLDVFQIDPDIVNTIDSRTLLYGDFMSSETRIYAQITDMIKLSKILDDYLEEYNKSTTAPMRLVMFLDAISHICRIARIIRQPFGNALLFGMGGSGRQSLTRLATFLSDYTCFQIELSKSYGTNEWREDIKGIMYKAGIYARETVFLFSDTQIKMESFLEDINNILNTGDVPNLYQLEELDKIYETMKAPVTDAGLLPTKSNLFSFYLKAVRSNMHCVLTMSPIGDVFRARLRQFPALVNCCTIDWFFPWPDAALQSVALQFLEDVPGLSASDELLENVVTICRFMHQSVINASGLFLQELSRHNYVTPTSFLELLSLYTSMLEKKKLEQETSINRLKTGLDKLLSTSEDVKVMQEELVALQPALEVAQKEAVEMLAIIEADTEIAEQTKQVVQGEEAEAAKIAQETQNIADDAQRDLEEAMPALKAAETALQSLNKNDITEIRAMMRPPEGVKLVLEVVCIVKNIKPNKVAGAKLGEKVLDYWDPAKAMLADPQAFLNSLLFFDKENLTDAIINKIQPYIDNPEFRPAKIIKVSKACTSLCQWVHAMNQYYYVNQAVAPKKAKLKDAMDKLELTERALAKSRGKMKKVMDGLAILNARLMDTIHKKEELERNWNLCQTRMKQAHRLVNGLVTERRRWLDSLATMQRTLVNIIGDILISAGAVSYLAPFTDKYRRGLLAEWGELEAELAVPHTPGCDPVSTLGDLVTIRKWQVDGLPRDYFSTESSVLVAQSKRWALFIDPQGQANKWIKNTYKGENLVVAKLNDKDLMRRIEGAISFGKTVILENVAQELDPSLDPILMKQTFMQGGQQWIKLGDSVVPYNSNFKLFLTTKLPNPHYTPEVSIKVLIVNFMLVPSGLQDQLLALVAMEERPDLEETRARIVTSISQGKSDLKELEDRILVKLSTSEGNPVDDIALIDSLEESKVMSEDIRERVDNAAKTQDIIDQIRSEYIPVARRAQILYFCVADLAKVDPMYQYSLEWFTKIFINSMAKTDKNCEVIDRIEIINDYFTFSLYSNVCRSMFERNKLQFAFLIAVRIMLDSNLIELDDYTFFLAGASPIRNIDNPAKSWLGVRSWVDILSLDVLPVFNGFVEHFMKSLDVYKIIVDSKDPQKEKMGGEWEEKLTLFQKMVVLKCLRPDKVTNAMQDFVSVNLGSQFIEPQSTELEAMYRESSTTVPLIFVLSTGTDPASDFYKFAEKLRMGKRIMSISLGQGQGPIAEKMFVEAMDIGSWVFFQNCHLAPSWMPRMEYLVENIPADTCHKDFRLWVTSTPSPDFPVSILQNGSKLTIEPPRGVKANLLRAYSSQISEFSDFINSDDSKVQGFKHLLFSLCLFHGVCLERRKYGPLGFNIPYEFTDGDLRICISQLYMFVREYKDIPFKVLLYTAGEINYGGRVTDDWDRRCIMNILSDFYNSTVLYSNHVFSDDGVYHQLKSGAEIVDYTEYVKSLPVNDRPGLFGLHENADISYAQGETFRSLSALLSLQPRATGGASGDQESSIVNTAKNVQSRVPKPFARLDEIEARYPVMYEESLNTVLVQEVIRYNKLLTAIHMSLGNLLKAVYGIIVMSDDLEKMSASLSTNKVPQMWASKAYPSLKPLGAWVSDLQLRVTFIQGWIDKGIPASFWMPGFYFPQAFLTGCLQNFARKYIVAIDTLSYKFKVLKVAPTARPKDGCVVYGLFMEGARWSSDVSLIRESRAKELYTDMAPIWFIPEAAHKKEDGLYNCPVYKTLQRAGTLSTTGHSTNYVVTIEIPTSVDQKHWIKRGVALFCALDF